MVKLFRSKDFQYMKVLSVSGKRLGYVNDILIDFHKGLVKGFSISTQGIGSKNKCIFIEDVISINKVILAKKVSEATYLSFKSIKDIEIYNVNGEIIGVLEDLLVDSNGVFIKGLMVASGLIHKLLYGKDIILPSNCILGEDSIYHYANIKKIKLKTLPHQMSTQVAP